MNNKLVSKQTCRFCLTETSKNIEYVREEHIDMLQIVLPDVPSTHYENSKICSPCEMSLKNIFNFKSSCLEIEDNIYDYRSDSKAQVNLEELVGLTENFSNNDSKICRTCFKVINDDFFPLSKRNTLLKAHQQKCIPEMDLSLTIEPVMCIDCVKILQTYFEFLTLSMNNYLSLKVNEKRKKDKPNILVDTNCSNIQIEECLTEGNETDYVNNKTAEELDNSSPNTTSVNQEKNTQICLISEVIGSAVDSEKFDSNIKNKHNEHQIIVPSGTEDVDTNQKNAHMNSIKKIDNNNIETHKTIEGSTINDSKSVENEKRHDERNENHYNESDCDIRVESNAMKMTEEINTNQIEEIDNDSLSDDASKNEQAKNDENHTVESDDRLGNDTVEIHENANTDQETGKEICSVPEETSLDEENRQEENNENNDNESDDDNNFDNDIIEVYEDLDDIESPTIENDTTDNSLLKEPSNNIAEVNENIDVSINNTDLNKSVSNNNNIETIDLDSLPDAETSTNNVESTQLPCASTSEQNVLNGEKVQTQNKSNKYKRKLRSGKSRAYSTDSDFNPQNISEISSNESDEEYIPVKSKKSRQTRFRCSDCPATCTSYSGLKSHMFSYHQSQIPNVQNYLVQELVQLREQVQRLENLQNTNNSRLNNQRVLNSMIRINNVPMITTPLLLSTNVGTAYSGTNAVPSLILNNVAVNPNGVRSEATTRKKRVSRESLTQQPSTSATTTVPNSIANYVVNFSEPYIVTRTVPLSSIPVVTTAPSVHRYTLPSSTSNVTTISDDDDADLDANSSQDNDFSNATVTTQKSRLVCVDDIADIDSDLNTAQSDVDPLLLDNPPDHAMLKEFNVQDKSSENSSINPVHQQNHCSDERIDENPLNNSKNTSISKPGINIISVDVIGQSSSTAIGNSEELSNIGLNQTDVEPPSTVTNNCISQVSENCLSTNEQDSEINSVMADLEEILATGSSPKQTVTPIKTTCRSTNEDIAMDTTENTSSSNSTEEPTGELETAAKQSVQSCEKGSEESNEKLVESNVNTNNCDESNNNGGSDGEDNAGGSDDEDNAGGSDLEGDTETAPTSEITNAKKSQPSVPESQLNNNADVVEIVDSDSEATNPEASLPKSTGASLIILNDHMCNANTLSVFKCDWCPFNTRYFQLIDMHVLTHFTQFSSDDEYACNKCPSKYPNKFQLLYHLQSGHQHFCYKLCFWCVNCARVFPKKLNVRRHFKNCTRKGISVKLFKSNDVVYCMLCNYETTDQDKAKVHARSCITKRMRATETVVLE